MARALSWPCPGHDHRDWEFANKHGLPISQVVAPLDGSVIDISEGAYVERGVVMNSGFIDGMNFEQAFDAIEQRFAEDGRGKRTVNYRLRDWGVSRQRYWGTPIPIIYCDDCDAQPVPEDQLPVILPEDVEVTGTGSPLKDMPEFYAVDCPNVASLRVVRRIPLIPSSSRPGISRATPVRIVTPRCSINAKLIGCRLINIRAVWNTRFYICSMRAFFKNLCVI